MTASSALTDDVLDEPRHPAAPSTARPRVLGTVPEPDAAERRSVRELWDEYKSTGASSARDLLVLEYAPYAKRIAEHLGRRLPSVDTADLVSWGIVGLIDALDKFDPGRGSKFESYAVSRIRGAIIDAIRSDDWVPRTVRRNTRAVNDAHSRLENELRRTPSRAEIASALQTSEPQVDRMLAEASCGHVQPLERNWKSPTEGWHDGNLSRILADPARDPAESFELVESDALLADAIRSLSDRDRLIVVLSYYEGLTLAEIGSTLDITESRVCQLRTQALKQLRRRLTASRC
jgi:RNA polymerase sigma factor for flagellar operon FliA